jgi:hypothetical protein
VAKDATPASVAAAVLRQTNGFGGFIQTLTLDPVSGVLTNAATKKTGNMVLKNATTNDPISNTIDRFCSNKKAISAGPSIITIFSWGNSRSKMISSIVSVPTKPWRKATSRLITTLGPRFVSDGVSVRQPVEEGGDRVGQPLKKAADCTENVAQHSPTDGEFRPKQDQH